MNEVETKAKPNLNRARAHHAMVSLGEAGVLITGGLGPDEEPLGTAELLVPGAEETTVLENLHLPRAGHSCLKLADGRVLLIGGAGARQRPEARIEAFDLKTKAFSVAGRLGVARVHQQAALLPGGQVLICGGQDAAGNALNAAELFNPATGSAAPIAAAMSQRRYHHQAVALEQGMVLITGGAGDSSSARSAELYDPNRKLFSAPIEMHAERVIHTATLLADGRVFTFSNGVGEIYSPATQGFSAVPGAAGPLIRDGHTATLLADGAVLILGGGMPEFSEDVLGAPLLFDPKSNTYVDLKIYNPLVNRADHAALRLGDGTVSITGGRTVHQRATDAVVFYHPASRQFQ